VCVCVCVCVFSQLRYSSVCACVFNFCVVDVCVLLCVWSYDRLMKNSFFNWLCRGDRMMTGFPVSLCDRMIVSWQGLIIIGVALYALYMPYTPIIIKKISKSKSWIELDRLSLITNIQINRKSDDYLLMLIGPISDKREAAKDNRNVDAMITDYCHQ
jgi:hypothetical protein